MLYKNARKLFVIASLSLLSFLLTNCGVWRNFTTYFNTYYNAKTLFDRTEEAILSQKKDIFAFREDVTGASNRLGSSARTSSFTQTSQNVNQNSFQTENNSQFNNQSTQNNQFNNQNTQNNQFNNQNTQFSNPNTQFNNQNTQFPNQTNSSSANRTALSTGQFGPDLTKVVEKCSKILQYDKESAYFVDALFIIGKAFYYQQEYASAQRKFLELAGLGETKYTWENNLWLAKTYLQLRSFDEGLKLIDEVKAEALKENDKDLYKEASITKISFYIFREDYRAAIEECKSLIQVDIDDETNALVSFELGKIYMQIKEDNNALEAFASVLKYSPTFDVEYQSRMEHAKLLKSLNKIDESENELNTLRNTGKFRSYLDEIMVELGSIYYDKDEIKPAIDLFLEVDSTYKGRPTAGLADQKLGLIYEKKYRDYDSSYKYYIKSVSMLADKELKDQTNDKVRNIDRYRQIKATIKKDSLDYEYVENPTKFDRDSIDYDVAYRQYTEENKKLIEQQQQGNTGEGGLRNQQNQQQIAVQQQLERLRQGQTGEKLKDEKKMTMSELIAAGKLKKPVRPKFSADSIKSILAEDYYGLGSLFFSELDVPDSAYIYFQKILNDFGKKPVAVKTMFAMGTYYETKNDTLKADSLYRYIYDNYPKNPLRAAVIEKLGLNKKNESQVAQSNTEDDPATDIYRKGEKLYYDKKYKEAMDVFRGIYHDYPKSSYASKSIYYVGLIYENNIINNDSAAAAYGHLISDYKDSPLVSLVTSKYNNYETEQKAIKEAENKKRKQDSTKTVATAPISNGNIPVEQKEKNNPPKIETPAALQTHPKDSLANAKAAEKSEVKQELKRSEVLLDKVKEVQGTSKDSLKGNNKILIPPKQNADSIKHVIEDRKKLLMEEENKKPALPDTTKVNKEIPK